MLMLFLVQGLIAEEITGFSSKHAQVLKAPNNSDGFVINLPNSRRNEARADTQMQFLDETLVATMARCRAGKLKYFPHYEGTQVESPLRDGKLLLQPRDGKAVVKVLLPSSFDDGCLAEILFTGLVGGGNNDPKDPKLPVLVYTTLSSSTFMIDVPGLIAVCKKGGFTIVDSRFYSLKEPTAPPRKIRLEVDLQLQLVYLLF